MRWSRFSSRPERTWLDNLPATLRDVGRDLLSIEINTTVKPGMTARKMGDLPLALIDIAQAYAGAMVADMHIDLAPWWNGPGADREQRRILTDALAPALGPVPKSKPPDSLTAGWDTFDRLRWAAAHARGSLPHQSHEVNVLLYRIERNCRELSYLVDRLLKTRPTEWGPYLGFPSDDPRSTGEGRGLTEELLAKELVSRPTPVAPPDEITRVRKIWDVGTERVLLQTVIQLDGDVVTRIAGEIAGDAQRELVKNALIAVHNESVTYALRYWGALFGILFALARARPAVPQQVEGMGPERAK